LSILKYNINIEAQNLKTFFRMKNNIIGDFKFVVIEKFLSYENELPLFEKIILNAGMSGNTPVGLIKSVSYSDEQLLRTHLSALCDTIQAEQLTSPAIILIGDIFQAAKQLHHFSAAA
jgi:precorrin-4 methylase